MRAAFIKLMRTQPAYHVNMLRDATCYLVLEMSVNVNVQALSTALAGALSPLLQATNASQQPVTATATGQSSSTPSGSSASGRDRSVTVR